MTTTRLLRLTLLGPRKNARGRTLVFRTFGLCFFPLLALHASAQLWTPVAGPSDLVIPPNLNQDRAGNSYRFTAEELLKTTPLGVTTVLAFPPSHPTQPGTIVYDYYFSDLAVDPFDNVYVAETPNHGALSYSAEPGLILKVATNGAVSTIAVAGTGVQGRYPNPTTLAVDGLGNVFTIGVNGAIWEIKTDGGQVTVAPASWFSMVGSFIDPPHGLLIDADGDVFTYVGHINSSILNGPVELVRLDASPIILSPPRGATIIYSSSVALEVTAASTEPLSYQWYRDGSPISGADGRLANIANNAAYAFYSAALSGSYQVRIFNSLGSVMSLPVVLTTVTSGGVEVTNFPAIVTQPGDAAIVLGGSKVLSAAAVAMIPVSFQWQLNGMDLPGATNANLTVTAAGAYRVIATTTAGAVVSDVAVVTLANRPANISSRAEVGTGGAVSIAGFVVASYSGAPKRVLIRAAGPALAALGVDAVLARPTLLVFDAKGALLASNAGWNNSRALADAAKTVGAFAYADGSQDSGLLLDLEPGAYTAQVSGAGETTGVGLVEVYELAADSGHFVNISTRAAVGTGGKILIGGLVLSGTQPSQVLIRAVGPTLIPLGVPGALASPVLSIYDSAGKLVAINVGWSNGGSADAVAIATAATKTGAFPLQPGSADSALLLTLAPGSYTAQVSGVNNATGIALVEVYQVPQ